MPRRLTTAKFIEKAKAVHGDRYDYSRVEYVNNKTSVAIICPEHGLFEQSPDNHISKGSGCPDCGGSKRLSTESFIERAKAVHDERYDYSSVNYANLGTKVTIICPDHGPFQQTPRDHLSKKGCPDCGGTKQQTTESFTERAKAVHGERYDYSQVEYVNARTNVTINCPDHGPFLQLPGHHLANVGCPDCGGSKQLTTESFIERAKAVHDERYDYSSVNYVNAHSKVMIICPEHGLFEQSPDNHISQGSGCPDCAESGFNPNDRATLYYLAIKTDDGDTRYKVGITNRSVEERFIAPDLARVRIVKTWQFATGRAAAEREARILRQYAGDKYNGPDILRSGNTELFTHDVLGLDRADNGIEGSGVG